MTRVKLAEVLRQRYPDHNWERVFLNRGKFALQRRLENALVALFPVSDYHQLIPFFPLFFVDRISISLFFEGQRVTRECEKGGRSDRSKYRAVCGIGFLSALPSSGVRISGATSLHLL